MEIVSTLPEILGRYDLKHASQGRPVTFAWREDYQDMIALCDETILPMIRYRPRANELIIDDPRASQDNGEYAEACNWLSDHRIKPRESVIKYISRSRVGFKSICNMAAALAFKHAEDAALFKLFWST